MNIFRKYDIRGIYGKNITEELFEKIGNAFGQIVSRDTVVARDSRLSSPSLKKAFIRGMIQTDANVTNIGEMPLACAMHWAEINMQELAYITGSHKAKEWNGIKFFHYNGLGYFEEEQQKIKQIIEKKKFVNSMPGIQKFIETEKVLSSYKNNILQKIKAEQPLRVVIDCGNGSTGPVVRDLFEKAGFVVETIFEEPDGNFPNRVPDPQEDNLKELSKRAEKADIGIAFDGDGDRIFLVDNKGRKLLPEQTSFLILDDYLKERKGPIVANVECNSIIDDVAKKYGCEVNRVQVGHTFLIEGVHKFNAVYGVERSGHFALPFISRFDDAIGVSLYAAYILSKIGKPLSEIVDSMQTRPFERLRYECSDENKFSVVERLKKKFAKEYDNVNVLDGIRIDTESGWVLIRASNTGPVIRLTVEADDEKTFEKLKTKFSESLVSEISKK